MNNLQINYILDKNIIQSFTEHMNAIHPVENLIYSFC